MKKYFSFDPEFSWSNIIAIIGLIVGVLTTLGVIRQCTKSPSINVHRQNGQMEDFFDERLNQKRIYCTLPILFENISDNPVNVLGLRRNIDLGNPYVVPCVVSDTSQVCDLRPFFDFSYEIRYLKSGGDSYKTSFSVAELDDLSSIQERNLRSLAYEIPPKSSRYLTLVFLFSPYSWGANILNFEKVFISFSVEVSNSEKYDISGVFDFTKIQ